VSILTITNDSTPEDIAEALGHMLAATQREQYVHRKSELHDEPTPWDQRHLGLDLLLEEWERAKARVPA
jgi:hypothetical protein